MEDKHAAPCGAASHSGLASIKRTRPPHPPQPAARSPPSHLPHHFFALIFPATSQRSSRRRRSPQHPCGFHLQTQFVSVCPSAYHPSHCRDATAASLNTHHRRALNHHVTAVVCFLRAPRWRTNMHLISLQHHRLHCARSFGGCSSTAASIAGTGLSLKKTLIILLVRGRCNALFITPASAYLHM